MAQEVPVSLLHKIEVYLRRTGTPPTRFGRAVVNDPRFVLDLRNGREPGQRTARRVEAYLDAENGAAR